jgi:hypothetical protein
MRRGGALSLLAAVDLDAGCVAVRRSVGVVKDKGKGERLVEGATKTGQSRVVDLDAGTVVALGAYRAVRGSVRWRGGPSRPRRSRDRRRRHGVPIAVFGGRQRDVLGSGLRSGS